jgi:hypothetical protein
MAAYLEHAKHGSAFLTLNTWSNRVDFTLLTALGSKLQSRNQSASLLQSLARAQIVLEHWIFWPALLSALS